MRWLKWRISGLNPVVQNWYSYKLGKMYPIGLIVQLDGLWQVFFCLKFLNIVTNITFTMKRLGYQVARVYVHRWRPPSASGLYLWYLFLQLYLVTVQQYLIKLAIRHIIQFIIDHNLIFSLSVVLPVCVNHLYFVTLYVVELLAWNNKNSNLNSRSGSATPSVSNISCLQLGSRWNVKRPFVKSYTISAGSLVAPIYCSQINRGTYNKLTSFY